MTTVHTIDLNYLGTPGAIASYVVTSDRGAPVMIETGPACTTDALESGLSEIGLRPVDVQHVLVTHIHFDHAGAAGWMARHGARIYVHEFGAPHLVDPSKLMRSAERIYGDRMDALWGRFTPIPADQVQPLYDGDRLDLGGVRFRVIETPGHARHHHAYALESNGFPAVAFTGDAAATHVAEAPRFISLPTPPPEFELGAWLASIERLRRERLDRIYPTHFGALDDVAEHLDRVKTALREHAEFVRRRLDDGVSEQAIREQYTEWFLEHATTTGLPAEQVGFYIKDTMAAMNVSGLLRYWQKLEEKMCV